MELIAMVIGLARRGRGGEAWRRMEDEGSGRGIYSPGHAGLRKKIEQQV